MKKIKFAIIIILIFQMLVSCSSSPYDYKYPKEYDAEYCYNNYEYFNPNIIFTECYELVSQKNYKAMNFSAINGIDDLSFMAYWYQQWGFGGGTWMCGVVRKKGVDIDPLRDYTISKIEICGYEKNFNTTFVVDPRKNLDIYYNYASYIFSDPIMTIEDEDAIAEIMAVVSRNTFLNDGDRGDGVYLYNEMILPVEDKAMCIKISFEECKGLVLVEGIRIDRKSEETYLAHKVYIRNNFKDNMCDVSDKPIVGIAMSSVYRLGENMDAIVKEARELVK